MRIRSLAVASLVGVLGSLIPASSAHAVVAAAPPGAAAYGYATPVVAVPRGGPIMFFNFDIDIHNFVAFEAYLPKKDAKDKPWCGSFSAKRCPVFWSPTIGPGFTPVEGLDAVEPGAYTFYCTVHPAMKGSLQVI